MKIQKIAILTISLLITIPASITLHGQNNEEIKEAVLNTRTLIQEWVDTRESISKRRSDWNVQKQIILNKIELLENEIENLQESIDDALSTANAATDQRSELNSREAELRQALRVVTTRLPEYEAQIQRYVDYFPEPLLSQIDTLVQALPKNRGPNTNTSAGNRLAVIVGILNEVDKFNKTIKLTRNVREIAGTNRQVKTVYLGNAIAFYSDEEGINAGIGKPARNGWEWTERNDIAPQIARMVGVAEGTIKPATFVELPMEVTNIE